MSNQVWSKNLRYLDRNIDDIHVNSFHLISVKKYYSYLVYIYLVYIIGWIHRSFHSFSGKTQLLSNYNVRGETTTVPIMWPALLIWVTIFSIRWARENYYVKHGVRQ